MKHGSLFSGIGGFDLASEWMGWENVFHCEIEIFPRKVLNHYWPESISYEDIKKTDFTIHKGTIDILTGGFPCQPYSSAGKRLGKEDERHLWPEMLRAIQEISPRWIVGENVRGLVNWNGGLVFDEVQSDLEAEGYKVQPFLLPAAAVNAPHRRDRIWFVAYSDKCNDRRNAREDEGKSGEERVQERNSIREFIEPSEIFGNAANASKERLQGGQQRGAFNQKTKTTGQQSSGSTTQQSKINDWLKFPTKSPVCSGNDGLPDKLDGITFSKWRNESIKGYGNAVVPQVVYQIFKAIEQYELKTRNTPDHHQ
jgi:DNA (cytosine-5)-methyltransferase 1